MKVYYTFHVSPANALFSEVFPEEKRSRAVELAKSHKVRSLVRLEVKPDKHGTPKLHRSLEPAT